MGLFSILGGVGSFLGGLGGLFNKPKTVSSGQNLMSLAQGARDASAATGFNPLTLLQAGAGTSGFTTGGVPPLASVELLTNGLRDINDVVSGDADRRRAADQLNLDMARLRFDQARSGVVTAPLSAADAVGGGLSPLGAKAVQVYPADGQAFGGGNAGTFGSRGSHVSGDVRAARRTAGGAGWLGERGSLADPRREVQNEPVVTDGGLSYIDNPKIGPPFAVPTFQGEIVDVTQLPVIAASGGVDYSLGLGGRTRQIMDQSGWTTPGTDYWTKWRYGIQDAVTGKSDPWPLPAPTFSQF